MHFESPRLLRLKRRGGSVDTYLALNQPWIRELGLATVLDIGANTGQYALTAREVFPSARIISFEPLPDCFAELTRRMKSDPNFTALNIGLGDTPGELNIQRNEFSPASSFLPLNDTHKTAFDFARRTQPVAVRVERLDDVAKKLALVSPYLAKLDVQGFEDRVIRGGETTLRGAALLIVEMAYEPLYDGQPLFREVYDQICALGFAYRGALDQLHCPRTGKLLQADGVFMKIKT